MNYIEKLISYYNLPAPERASENECYWQCDDKMLTLGLTSGFAILSETPKTESSILIKVVVGDKHIIADCVEKFYE